MSGFAKGSVGSKDGAKVRDHEIVFRTRSHDLAIVVAVWGPDEELTFVGNVRAVTRLFVGVGDSESDF